MTFMGDLKNEQTEHSFACVFALYTVRIKNVSPEWIRMPMEILEELASRVLGQYRGHGSER